MCDCGGCGGTTQVNSAINGLNGIYGGYSQRWLFDSNTAVTPASGYIRLNNSVLASVTTIYISDTNDLGVLITPFVQGLVNNGSLGFIRIFKEYDSSQFWYGQVVSILNNTNDSAVTVTYVMSNGSFNLGDKLVLSFSPQGNPGTNGLFGGFSGDWTFSTTLTPTPASSTLRLNSATPSAVTSIYVSNNNINGVAYGAFLATLSNSGNFGYVRLFKALDNTKFWLGTITAVVANGSDYTLTVTYIGSASNFSANDDVVLTFAPFGATGATGATYPTNADFSRALDTSFTLVAGTDKNIIFLNSGSTTTTTANRTWTITPTVGQNSNFRFIIPAGKVGSGYTITIVNSAGPTTLITLLEGSIDGRQFDCYWNGLAYTVVRTTVDVPAPTDSTNFNVLEGILGTEWSFAGQGGSHTLNSGVISLPTVIPDGAIIKADQAIIECKASLATGTTSQVAWGYTGVPEAFDSYRDSGTYPYNTVNGVVKGASFGSFTGSSGTINKRTGLITTASLAGVAGSVTSITLNNNLVVSTSKVNVTLGAYSGTYNTNGLPVLLSAIVSNGQVAIEILNAHATNALSGTLLIMFNIEEEGANNRFIKVVGAGNQMTMTIATGDLTAGYIRLLVPYFVRKF